MSKIGIDFGTTNSLIVAYEKEKNKFTYFNYTGDTPVPTSSTVWYYDDKIVVGAEAREKMHQYSDIEGHHFEKSIKRKLGEGKRISVFGDAVEPYMIAAKILSQLKKKAIEDYEADKVGADLNRAVFTVPINFSGRARRDLRKSANEAGIEITTFIHEPFAAIVGYYFTKMASTHMETISKLLSLDDQYILTFDWGGGTLDITVVLVKDGKMIEVGTAELTDKAGDKFDEDIARMVWNRFLDKYGTKYSSEYLEEIRKSKWGRMLAISERCKIELSTENQTYFLIEKITSTEEGIDEIITRDDLESLIEDTLGMACNRIDKALEEAGLHDIDVSHVLLTGGTCYIPVVQKRLRQKFGHRVETVENADLLIAQGAAVISELGWVPFLTKDIQIELCDGSFWPIFEKGQPVVAENDLINSEVFTCVDQRGGNAKIIVCEGTDSTKDKNLTVLNVPVLADPRFHDDIVVDADLDRDIVMTISARSKMVHGYGKEENYSIRKSSEVHQMCFGLDFEV